MILSIPEDLRNQSEALRSMRQDQKQPSAEYIKSQAAKVAQRQVKSDSAPSNIRFKTQARFIDAKDSPLEHYATLLNYLSGGV